MSASESNCYLLLILISIFYSSWNQFHMCFMFFIAIFQKPYHLFLHSFLSLPLFRTDIFFINLNFILRFSPLSSNLLVLSHTFSWSALTTSDPVALNFGFIGLLRHRRFQNPHLMPEILLFIDLHWFYFCLSSKSTLAFTVYWYWYWYW